MSIGVVLDRLHQEFPDVTVSKIRFLESEGLVAPQRSASGYRRFTDADVERLRYVLRNQRDHYTPLKVIRQQLEAMDSGQVTALLVAGDSETMVSPDSFRAPMMTRLTDDDVAQQAGVTADTVATLVEARLVTPDEAGFFTADDVAIVRTADALRSFGFDTRHLRMLRNGARRQADLIAQAAGPVAHVQGDESAPQRAEETARQMAALVVSLHAALVKDALGDEFRP